VEPRQDRIASENDLIVRLNCAEEALHPRELNFQLIVESIPAPLAVITPTGQVEALNQPLFSRKDAATELVDLNEATREVIALPLSDLQRDKVILKSELADELPMVEGDRVQLQQVILNLLRNASDAMSSIDDRPRQLLIKTEQDAEGGVRLSVQDAGVGFEPDSINKLFDSFYTTKGDGMGIGLSVSRSIIENHHGRLWAQPNDGPGATFLFSLPCEVTKVTDAASRDLNNVRNLKHAARST
jgi:signal transduction histidine kinase